MGNKTQAEMETKAELVAVDAPPVGSGERTGVWKRRLAPLQTDENTGQWFRVFVTSLAQARTYKWNLENGKLKAPTGIFEYAAGSLDEATEDGDAGLFARYIGPEDESEAEVEVEAPESEDADQE